MALSINRKVDVLLALYDIRAKWRTIGLCVRVRNGDLEAILSEPGDIGDKLDRMVTQWLNEGENCTWATLAAALRSRLVGAPKVAREIELKYCGGVRQVPLEAHATSAATTAADNSVPQATPATPLSEQPDPLKKECTAPLPSYAVISSANSVSWFSWELEQRGLINSQVRNDVEATTDLSPTEKFTHLLEKIDFSNPEIFNMVLDIILHGNPALCPIADMLASFHEYDMKKSQLHHDIPSSTIVSSAGSTPSHTDLGEINVTPIEANYTRMICDLAKLLGKHSGALESMVLTFESILCMKGTEKFKSLIESKSYSEIKSVQEFFRRVISKLKPEDCSLLHCLVNATGCEEAVARLRDFEISHKERNVLVKEQPAEAQETPSSTSNPPPQPQESQAPHNTESHPPIAKREAAQSSPQEAANDASSSQPPAKPESLEITARVAKGNITRGEYDTIARTFCGVLKISRWLLDLTGFEPGSVTIKWRVSMDLLPHIQSVVLDSWDLRMLQKEGVVDVRVGSYFHITVGSHDYWRATFKVCQEASVEDQLIRASVVGDMKTVVSLLQLGADPNYTDKNGIATIHRVKRIVHSTSIFRVYQTLLNIGDDVGVGEYKAEGTALSYASLNGYFTIVQRLLDAGANVEAQDIGKATALHLASYNGHLSVVQRLLDAGANVGAQKFNGWTALNHASQNGHVTIVQRLLDAGANVGARTKNGNTSLHIASQNGHHTVVQKLLDAGANVGAQNKLGSTALHTASLNGHFTVVQKLLDAGANVGAQDSWGCTPLVRAIQFKETDVAKELAVRGVGLDIPDEGGVTALMYAIQVCDEEVVSLLVGKGANVSAQSKEGLTALMMATTAGQESTVDILIKSGRVNLNTQEKSAGWSALYHAAKEGHVKIATMLTEAGADILLKDNNGVTARDVARTFGRQEIYQLLEEKMMQLKKPVKVEIQDGQQSVQEKSHQTLLDLVRQSGSQAKAVFNRLNNWLKSTEEKEAFYQKKKAGDIMADDEDVDVIADVILVP